MFTPAPKLIAAQHSRPHYLRLRFAAVIAQSHQSQSLHDDSAVINHQTSKMHFATLIALIVGCTIRSLALECVVSYSESASGTGTPRTTFGNISYCEYLGVRYGKSTAGEGRFRASEAHEPNGREDYSKQGNVCPQLDDINYPSVVLGDEDCLFLNVYNSVEIDGDSYLRPVLVFIHGGSFTFGSAGYDVHGVDLLMENVRLA